MAGLLEKVADIDGCDEKAWLQSACLTVGPRDSGQYADRGHDVLIRGKLADPGETIVLAFNVCPTHDAIAVDEKLRFIQRPLPLDVAQVGLRPLVALSLIQQERALCWGHGLREIAGWIDLQG